MSILADILGTGDVVKAGLDLIDDMHTSEEEAIAAKTKAKIDMIRAYHPYKKAQRFLALMFCGTYLLCFFLAVVMTLFGRGNIDDLMGLIDTFYIAIIALTIVGFYFGGGAFEGIINARGKKDER